ncbi:hypothetical protein KFE25_002685 [Diacronema lutheri]|uniref:Amino acid transporter transmembrane domain-containing protein n=2 Tax=Diacronema lutheri TaxID=2081491 RepID=A0A8J5XED6_DIALT|nr:hypothetical protein KFE25_002685 [Diacronema lutheri]
MEEESPEGSALLCSTSQLTTPLLTPADQQRGVSSEHADERPVATAGIAGSIFNLSAATLGAGALSLPYAVSLIGVRLALVLLGIAVAGAFLSIELLVDSLDAARCATYELVTAKRLGRRAAACVEAAILAFCVGTCVAYTIALGDILDALLVKPQFLPAWAPRTRSQLMVGAWALVLLPISLPRSLAALQGATFLGTLALCVLVGTVCAHAIRAAGATAPHAPAPPLGPPPATPPPPSAMGEAANVARALSIIMFAFTCQVNVPEVYAELRQRSKARMRRVAAGALSIALTLYVLIGVAAFSEFGAHTRADVLGNYLVWAADGHDRDMLPAYALMGATIVVAYPFNVFPARQTLLTALGYAERAPADAPRAAVGRGALHVVLTLAITGAALLAALFVPGINVVFQLLGGTASALVCFCVPGLLALRSELPLLASVGGRAAVYALVAGGAVVGAVSTAVTVAGFFL